MPAVADRDTWESEWYFLHPLLLKVKLADRRG